MTYRTNGTGFDQQRQNLLVKVWTNYAGGHNSFDLLCLGPCSLRTVISVTLRSGFLTEDEVNAILTEVRDLIGDRPVLLGIGDEYAKAVVLSPIISDTRYLFISKCRSPRATSGLAGLNFTDLISFGLKHCDLVVVEKNDFVRYQKLRVIGFSNVTFASIEPGTFTDLPDLQLVSLDGFGGWFSCEDNLQRLSKSILKLHCDCEYGWLRSWLKKNPKLLTGGNLSQALMIEEDVGIFFLTGSVFVPVDCADQSPTKLYNVDVSRTEFTANDPCS